MTEQLISFETAKLAKEKGFNINTLYYYGNSKEEYDRDVRVYKERLEKNGEEECRKYFNKNYPLWCAGTLSDGTIHGYDKGTSERIMFPTQSLLQKWLRETYDINISVRGRKAMGYTAEVDYLSTENLGSTMSCPWYSVYEDCLEKALFEALKRL